MVLLLSVNKKLSMIQSNFTLAYVEFLSSFYATYCMLSPCFSESINKARDLKFDEQYTVSNFERDISETRDSTPPNLCLIFLKSKISVNL